MTRQSVADALKRLAPEVPRFERGAILDHAAASQSLRKATPEEAAWLSMVAFVRHQMTDYDDLLQEGYDADSARFAIADEMTEILRGWGVRRRRL